jgi:hypothetical protein
MANTYKDHPDVRAARAARRQHMQDIGARSLLGYGASHDDDPADSAEQRQALAEYIRMGGFVNFLGRKV